MDALKETKLKGKTLRNKLVMAPMTTYSGNEDYTPSEEELNYYRLRSKTVGMVITAATAVSATAHAFETQISLESDAYIKPQATLARTIKEEGALAIAQLHHGGRMNNPNLYENSSNIVAPSPVKAKRDNAVTPRAMEEEEVIETVEDFKNAAVRAKKAGFDGVEIHGANTYLLQQFFSGHSNVRDDRYGGSLEKRMTFIDEVTDAIIEATGDETFIIGYRLSPEEIEDHGITLQDTEYLVDRLNMKNLDYIHLSLRHYAQRSMRDETVEVPVTSRLKSRLRKDLPLIVSGDIHTSEDLLHAGKLGSDFFALGTALLADPYAGETLKERGDVDRTFKKDTLPENLYTRLKKNEHAFKHKGYGF
ncbi:MAG: NADH-dependent flavin oxidoreductase [Bacillota bacterium]